MAALHKCRPSIAENSCHGNGCFFANRTNKHGGSSANPRVAQWRAQYYGDECVLISSNDDFRATAIGAKQTFVEKRRPLMAENSWLR